jgi:hypothetical protein
VTIFCVIGVCNDNQQVSGQSIKYIGLDIKVPILVMDSFISRVSSSNQIMVLLLENNIKLKANNVVYSKVHL